MYNYKHNPSLTGKAKQLRKTMTKEECHLWYDFLRDYPVRVLRQKVIDNYIVDFYCRAAGVVIELDGSQHYEPTEQQYDQIRTAQIERRDLLVIRIPNNEVNNNFRAVCEFIDLQIQNRLQQSR